MQYSVAFLGLSVGPAIINSLIIILGGARSGAWHGQTPAICTSSPGHELEGELLCASGVILNYWLDDKIESPGFLFGGAGLAAVALFLCTLARLEHDKSLRRSGSDAASLSSSSTNILAAGMRCGISHASSVHAAMHASHMTHATMHAHDSHALAFLAAAFACSPKSMRACACTLQMQAFRSSSQGLWKTPWSASQSQGRSMWSWQHCGAI